MIEYNKEIKKEKEFLCKICGECNSENFYTSKDKDGRIRKHKSLCKKCHGKYTYNLKRKYKSIIVKEFGGKCSICGYNNCIGALEFHHEKQEKDIQRFEAKRNGGLEYFRRQVKDCVLLCSNCHREKHYNS